MRNKGDQKAKKETVYNNSEDVMMKTESRIIEADGNNQSIPESDCASDESIYQCEVSNVMVLPYLTTSYERFWRICDNGRSIAKNITNND